MTFFLKRIFVVVVVVQEVHNKQTPSEPLPPPASVSVGKLRGERARPGVHSPWLAPTHVPLQLS